MQINNSISKGEIENITTKNNRRSTVFAHFNDITEILYKSLKTEILFYANVIYTLLINMFKIINMVSKLQNIYFWYI